MSAAPDFFLLQKTFIEGIATLKKNSFSILKIKEYIKVVLRARNMFNMKINQDLRVYVTQERKKDKKN